MYKVGDLVKMDLNIIMKLIGRIPYWYCDKTFKVIATTDIKGGYGTHQSILLEGFNVNSNNKNDNTIYGPYLKYDLVTMRKLKLESLSNV